MKEWKHRELVALTSPHFEFKVVSCFICSKYSRDNFRNDYGDGNNHNISFYKYKKIRSY